MKTDVLMPRIGANDNYVTLCCWNVAEGEFVVKGQVIAQIETTKESGEIEATSDGYIHLKVENNQEIAVGQVVCVIADVYEKQNAKEEKHYEDITISIKARKLMEQYGIDVKVFSGSAIVREKDVLQYVENNKKIENDVDIKVEVDECCETVENQLLINGGGGFCKMAIEMLQQRGEYEIAGVLDRKYVNGMNVKGIPVIDFNDEEALKRLYEKKYRLMVNAIAFDRNKHDRKNPYLLMKKCGFKVVNVIHNRAVIEPSVRMGEGNIIVANAMLGTDVRIGNNCIINAGTIISHDCVIGSHSHIASGTVLGGGVVVGENTLIGQGCTVFKGIKIGKNVVISNGVHIFENVPDGTIIR